MSLTNPGAQRVPLDNYPTPEWLTRAIMPIVARRIPNPRTILEPASGSGAITRILRETFPRSRITGIDIAPPINIDFLTAKPRPEFDLTIMNPPFLLAQEFIERAKLWRASNNSPIVMSASPQLPRLPKARRVAEDQHSLSLRDAAPTELHAEWKDRQHRVRVDDFRGGQADRRNSQYVTASCQSAIIPPMKKSQREEPPMVKLTVRLPENLVERAKIAAVKQKTTLQEMTRVALEAHLKEVR